MFHETSTPIFVYFYRYGSSVLMRFGVHVLECFLGNLAGGQARHGIELVEDARHLVEGQILLQVLLEFAARHFIAGLDGVVAAADVAAHLVRHADDGCISDVRIAVEQLFNLARVDVLAHADDQFLDAVDDVEVAVFIAPDDVARVEPAAGQRARCLLRGGASSRA